MAKAKKEEAIVEIRPLDIKVVPIKIVGDTPLIVHAWSEKAKKMMLDAQTKATHGMERRGRHVTVRHVQARIGLVEQAWLGSVRSGYVMLGRVWIGLARQAWLVGDGRVAVRTV